MSNRSDPMVPILGSAVTLLVLGASLFVFYPAYRQWRAGDSGAVVGHPPSPTESLPVWICRSEPGVALLIEGLAGDPTKGAASRLAALQGGPYHYLRLSVFNFDGRDPLAITLPEAGFGSPEGGPPALPALPLLRAETSAKDLAVLRGLGAVGSLEVPRGRRGQALLVMRADPSSRTAFVSGGLTFTRHTVTRQTLAAWHAEPGMKAFEDL